MKRKAVGESGHVLIWRIAWKTDEDNQYIVTLDFIGCKYDWKHAKYSHIIKMKPKRALIWYRPVFQTRASHFWTLSFTVATNEILTDVCRQQYRYYTAQRRTDVFGCLLPGNHLTKLHPASDTPKQTTPDSKIWRIGTRSPVPVVRRTSAKWAVTPAQGFLNTSESPDWRNSDKR